MTEILDGPFNGNHKAGSAIIPNSSQADSAISKATTTNPKELKDSGTRQEYNTGAVRDAEENKGMVELNPPWATFAIGWIMEAGAKKYSSRNWERGMPISRYIR